MRKNLGKNFRFFLERIFVRKIQEKIFLSFQKNSSCFRGKKKESEISFRRKIFQGELLIKKISGGS